MEQPYPVETELLMNEAINRGLRVRPSNDEYAQISCGRATVEVFSRDMRKHMEIHLKIPGSLNADFSRKTLFRAFDEAAQRLGYS